jgi:hypothetical protein
VILRAYENRIERKDPDGIEFELMWRVPRESWGEYETKAVVMPLDLQRELARFGA